MKHRRKKDPILTATEVRSLLEILREVSGPPKGRHLSQDEVERYRAGGFSEGEVERIDRHMASCEMCAIRMEKRLTAPQTVPVLQAEVRALVATRVASVGRRQPPAAPPRRAAPAPTAPAPEGEAFALEPILEKVEPKARRILAKFHIGEEEAKYILEDTVVALIARRERVRHPESWFLSTVRRRCILRWRLHRQRLTSAIDNAILELLSDPNASPRERSELVSDLERLLDRVPSRCRALLRLRFQLDAAPEEGPSRREARGSRRENLTRRCLSALASELLSGGEVVELGQAAEEKPWFPGARDSRQAAEGGPPEGAFENG